MNRTIFVGVMVLGTSICSQSFGFDLLDRMLGLKGGGCESTCCDTGVGGLYAEPTCGLEAPCGSCGDSAFGLGSSCCAEPACGCEAPVGFYGAAAGPACGCETACNVGCCDTGFGSGRHGLLDRLFGGLGCCDHGCDSACGTGCFEEPACGCEVVSGYGCGCPDAGCDSGCFGGHGRGGLLQRLFGGHHGNACCDTACDAVGACCGGIGSPMPYETMAPSMEAAPRQQVSPMPPAPVVDPSAYLHSKRRVIQASTHYTR